MHAERLLHTFLDLAHLDNASGQETLVVNYLFNALESLGLELVRDDADNLLARVPGEGEPLLLNAHTDSVVPCTGVVPVVENGVVRSSGNTVLGADDLAGVAAILEGVRSVLEWQKPHRAAEILFTSQEEVGLQGARAFDYSQLRARTGFVFDASGELGGICLGAPSQDTLRARVLGKAAHAGVAPEDGISAIIVAAEALVAMPLGRIDDETTANIGIIQGGSATNIVTPEVLLRGEARSHHTDKLDAQMAAMSAALRSAAEQHGAQVEITVTRNYDAYRLSPDEPVVQQARAVLESLGLRPVTYISGGGSDANIFAQHGIRVANLSLNYQAIHSVDEHISVHDLEQAAHIVTALLRQI